MSGMIYALALFGCSDDATICERLADKARTFESRVQCEMSMDQAFEGEAVRRADYPSIIGKCMDQGHLAKLNGRAVDLSRHDVQLASRNAQPGA